MGELPLAGLAVLVTRPADQAETLCGLIEKAGGRALRLPLLDIVPEDDPAPAAALFRRQDYWDWVIFVSANAVRHAPADPAGRLRIPRGARVAAVGEATARTLEEKGIRVDLIPKPQFNSESLLAHPDLADVAGRRMLIVRGQGGRELLAETLRARGAETAYAEVYRRVRPAVDGIRWVALWRQGGIDAVVVTSGETLAHLMELFGEAGAEIAYRLPLIVISARIEAQARERGWKRVYTTSEASDRAVADLLIRLRSAERLQPESQDAGHTHKDT